MLGECRVMLRCLSGLLGAWGLVRSLLGVSLGIVAARRKPCWYVGNFKCGNKGFIRLMTSNFFCQVEGWRWLMEAISRLGGVADKSSDRPSSMTQDPKTSPAARVHQTRRYGHGHGVCTLHDDPFWEKRTQASSIRHLSADYLAMPMTARRARSTGPRHHCRGPR